MALKFLENKDNHSLDYPTRHGCYYEENGEKKPSWEEPDFDDPARALTLLTKYVLLCGLILNYVQGFVEILLSTLRLLAWIEYNQTWICDNKFLIYEKVAQVLKVPLLSTDYYWASVTQGYSNLPTN